MLFFVRHMHFLYGFCRPVSALGIETFRPVHDPCEMFFHSFMVWHLNPPTGNAFWCSGSILKRMEDEWAEKTEVCKMRKKQWRILQGRGQALSGSKTEPTGLMLTATKSGTRSNCKSPTTPVIDRGRCYVIFGEFTQFLRLSRTVAKLLQLLQKQVCIHCCWNSAQN